MSDHKLLLAAETPLLKGSARHIYQHPHDKNLLVKVLIHQPYATRPGSLKEWRHELRFRFKHLCVLRELNEYVRIKSIATESSIFPHLASFRGFADTDLGPGIIVEAQKDQYGKLAPTYTELLKTGRFDAQAAADLEAFFQTYKASSLVMSDLTGRNIVYAWQGDCHRFMIIDGLGDKTLFPIRSTCAISNKLLKIKSIERQRRRYRKLFKHSIMLETVRAISTTPLIGKNSKKGK
ncbi:YrbL family protein [Marinospirillum alkaliphilum]|uniref:PhoP regulatory network protein YrbL n=1 Tax=Marinospirillum alkaliphilum DSM 21637 TaxID=1122209 RepID=A0A1K1U8G8_9GAMM|nr:YrbL family protein [Marinospirillum alkaliphilum]SFX09143.1 PhoP regulatory network protein YrbL [Marinospirillum alkaliphilum DSM 21637]